MKALFLTTVFAVLLSSINADLFAQSKSDSTEATLPGEIKIVREGYENPFKEVAKSTTAGFGAGLVLAMAINLVFDDTEEVGKWLVFGGTVAGLASGIYHVSKRPQPRTALMQFEPKGEAKLAMPQPQLYFENGKISGVGVPLFSASF